MIRSSTQSSSKFKQQTFSLRLTQKSIAKVVDTFIILLVQEVMLLMVDLGLAMRR